MKGDHVRKKEKLWSMSKMYSLVRQTHTQGEAEEVTVPG